MSPIGTEAGAGEGDCDQMNWRIIKHNREDMVAEFTLRIEGMHCGSCVRRVSQTLASTEGLKVDEVRLGAARLEAEQEAEAAERAIEALKQAGYTATLER